MRAGRVAVLAAVLVAGVAQADLSPTPKVAATQAALRDLWVGHIFWVRNVALATISNQKDVATAAEAEVVANAKQIAGALEPYYGKPASEKMFTPQRGEPQPAQGDAEEPAGRARRAPRLAERAAQGEEVRRRGAHLGRDAHPHGGDRRRAGRRHRQAVPRQVQVS